MDLKNKPIHLGEIHTPDGYKNNNGITFFEYCVVQAMKGYLSSGDKVTANHSAVAQLSIRQAEAVVAELEKKQETETKGAEHETEQENQEEGTQAENQTSGASG